MGKGSAQLLIESTGWRRRSDKNIPYPLLAEVPANYIGRRKVWLSLNITLTSPSGNLAPKSTVQPCRDHKRLMRNRCREPSRRSRSFVELSWDHGGWTTCESAQGQFLLSREAPVSHREVDLILWSHAFLSMISSLDSISIDFAFLFGQFPTIAHANQSLLHREQ